MDKNKKIKSVQKVENTSWGSVADWYDENVEQAGSYQRDLILPNLMRLIAVKAGEKIIDIACGQGLFSREFTKAGASVSGLDVSAELIHIAKERSKGLKINYLIAPADKLPFNIEEFDKAAIVLALQDIENLSGVINEAFRVLKTKGELFVVINHPAFRIPKRSAWEFDEKNKIQYRRIDEYISESRIKMEASPGKDKSKVTTSFHRPFQTYFKAFQKSGFVVSRLEEWVSGKQSEPGPRANAENKVRREFPLFMAIVAKKI